MSFRAQLGLTIGAAVLSGLFYLIWLQGQAGPAGYLFGTRNAKDEAGYCLAVAERAVEMTRGGGDPRFAVHLAESIAFWRGRVGDGSGRGRVRLAQDSNRPEVSEADWLRRAIGDCAHRASGFYGHHFSSMEGL